ncbi:MAG: DHH family phosphoesterase [Candidatus Diapherotrites archaeon]|nr:DHH family phosphoesterase [Candidatus Diapherotrites archaeon]
MVRVKKQQNKIDSIVDFFKKKKSATVALYIHESPDIDAISSQFAFKYFLGKINPKLKVCAVKPHPIHPSVKAYSRKLDFNFDKLSKNPDIAVLLDASTMSLLPYPELEEIETKVIIDHHSGDDIKTDSSLSLIDTDAISCTEIVYNFFKKYEIAIPQNLAAAMAAGIIADSARFHVSTPDAFKAIAELQEISKKKYVDLIHLISSEPDLSRKIAQLKAAQRLKMYKVDDFLFATSYVGAFESNSASALVYLGADVSFVLSDNKDSFVVSSRASSAFISKTGLDLGKLMGTVGMKLGGTGGGHPGAAAFSFHDGGKEQQALQMCLDELLNFLKQRKIVKKEQTLHIH